MKKNILTLALMSAVASAGAQNIPTIPHNAAEDVEHIMSEAYWAKWGDDVQDRIDKDIDSYRKGDATFNVGRIKKGSYVKVEQIASEFVFGASAFNWNQLGDAKANERYRELFGTLFNRATVPFYWTAFEQVPGRMRFEESQWDTEQWWIKHKKDAMLQDNWRRPATDPIVDWCNAHGCAVHGHPLVWGNQKWQLPSWLQYYGLPENEIQALDTLSHKMFTSNAGHCPLYDKMTPQNLAQTVPVFLARMEAATNRRIEAIMNRYRGRVQSWDVVNESAVDFTPDHKSDDPMWKSPAYGIMNSDYTYKAFKKAATLDSGEALLNINDYWIKNDQYLRQVKSLVSRGCRIDVIGSQMHLFNPQQCLDIAAGKSESKLVEFDKIRNFFAGFEETGIPMCLSEITITSAGDGHRGEMIQAIIARNLYRAWFSVPNMMGITWWNIVDGCGAPGEPVISGLFHRDMTPKTAYYALNELILNEWRTSAELTPDNKGNINWRGFYGTYRITWTDKKGVEHSEVFTHNH